LRSELAMTFTGDFPRLAGRTGPDFGAHHTDPAAVRQRF
jgi:hypothetical protein